VAARHGLVNIGYTSTLRAHIRARKGEPRIRDTTDLMRRLEEGLLRLTATEEWRRWLNLQARLHEYSFGNVLLILSQRPDATLVAGFQTWRALGRRVKRGERGIRILAPVTVRLEREVAPVELHGEERRTQRQVVTFRVVTVFDVAQTEGQPLPVQPRVRALGGYSPEGGLLAQQLAALVEREGLTVTRSPDLGLSGALGVYRPQERTIVLRAGLTDDQEAKTLTHELAHHLLGHRGLGDRSAAEVAAESVAYVVCQHYGLDTSDYSFPYVATWAGDNRKAILERVKEVGHAVQRTAQRIIDALDRASAGQPQPITSPTAVQAADGSDAWHEGERRA
jgi:DNA primase